MNRIIFLWFAPCIDKGLVSGSMLSSSNAHVFLIEFVRYSFNPIMIKLLLCSQQTIFLFLFGVLNLGMLEFHLVESHTSPGQPRLVVGVPRAVVNMEVLVQETVIGIVI